VTEEEKEAITQNAASCGLTPATMMRKLGTGYRPKSVVDHQHIVEMLKVNGDLSRLGNLLKLWLSNSSKVRGFKNQEIKQLRGRIGEVVEEMDKVITQIERQL
jgi:hypothetical protein